MERTQEPNSFPPHQQQQQLQLLQQQQQQQQLLQSQHQNLQKQQQLSVLDTQKRKLPSENHSLGEEKRRKVEAGNVEQQQEEEDEEENEEEMEEENEENESSDSSESEEEEEGEDLSSSNNPGGQSGEEVKGENVKGKNKAVSKKKENTWLPKRKPLNSLQIGDHCFCLWGDLWYVCEVLETKSGQVLLRYCGQKDMYDEWVEVSSVRLRPIDRSDMKQTKEIKRDYNPRPISKGVETQSLPFIENDTLIGQIVWFQKGTNYWLPGKVEFTKYQKNAYRVMSFLSQKIISVSKDSVVSFTHHPEAKIHQTLQQINEKELFTKIIELSRDLFDNSFNGKIFQCDEIEIKDSEDVTVEMFDANGFQAPFVIQRIEGHGIKVPKKKDFTLEKVIEILGEQFRIPVMDCETQQTLPEKWTLGEYYQYMQSPGHLRTRLLSVISMEISETPLAKSIQRPQIVKEIDVIDKIWPATLRKENFYPTVQLYCLFSPSGSFRDFHLDFGGSCAFYHVIKGMKIFYLIPPTKVNLQRYEFFMSKIVEQDRIAHGKFADLVAPEERYILRLHEGCTLLIPSGWIYSISTPNDSIAVGGNFLTTYTTNNQVIVHKIEKRIPSATQFRFPYFEILMFYLGKHLSKKYKKNELIPSEREGIKNLYNFIKDLLLEFSRKDWNERSCGTPMPFPFRKCKKLTKKLKKVSESVSDEKKKES